MKRSPFYVYIINIIVSILVVLGFAFIQYHIIRKLDFVVVDYIIPAIVGGIFGYLIASIRILEFKYKAEKEEVEKKNNEIHSYLGSIVHDLRSPVSAINGLAKILVDNKELEDSKREKYLNLILSSSNSVLENIGLILENSKIEKGVGPQHIIQGNPYFTINSTIDKHLVLAVQKSISIQRIIDKNLPDVKYDKDVLDSVISNLISNAIKYSPHETQIKVYTELFADRLDLVVQDQGLGMSDKDLDELFQEFHKLSSKPTGGEASSGLGLFVANKLVKQIGGEIIAESEGKNKGSTFRVRLKLS